MRIGAIFPHFEFGSDPEAVRAYARAAEGLGMAHIGADDHVIGPNPDRPGGYTGWTTFHTAFHEPFVLFGFMAAVTARIEFATCVLILPQRQTVLAAKQAAALDVLSGGRLRLGIGNGWNEIEYQSLGMDFSNRGSRIEEQVTLMRRLWTEEHVDFRAAIIGSPMRGSTRCLHSGPSHLVRRPIRAGDPPYRSPGGRLDAALQQRRRGRWRAGAV